MLHPSRFPLPPARSAGRERLKTGDPAASPSLPFPSAPRLRRVFYFRAGSFKGFRFYNTDGNTLTGADFGYFISVGAPGAAPVINLPNSSSFGNSAKEGGAITIENLRDDANLVVRVPNGQFWYYPPAGLTNVPPSRDLLLGPRQTVVALARGTLEWNPIGGSWRSLVGLGTAATKNVGNSANNVVQLDGSGRLPAVDGSQLTNLSIPSTVAVRQTVMSGPALNGLPNFLPVSTASLSITSQNISTGANALVVTAANGFGIEGAVNVIGVSTANLTWSGLMAATTNYLGVTISGGSLTPFSTTLAPIYQRGGTISTANGQHTFDIIRMQMYLGNGSVANPVNVVFVGEAATGANAVTSAISYAYCGYYQYNDSNSLPGPATVVSKNHNIGANNDVNARIRLICVTAEMGYSVGDVVANPVTWTSSYTAQFMPVSRRLTVSFITGSTYNGWHLLNFASGNLSSTSLTAANWRYQIVVERGW